MKDIIQRESYQKRSIDWSKSAHSSSSSRGSQSDVSKGNNKVNTSCTAVFDRKLKHPGRRQRQKEYYKFAYLTVKNGTFARFACPLFIFVHFAAVLVLSTTWNDLFRRCVNDVINWRQIFTFLFPSASRSYQFNSRIVSILKAKWLGMITEAWCFIFRWRSFCRRRRPSLSSLISCSKMKTKAGTPSGLPQRRRTHTAGAGSRKRRAKNEATNWNYACLWSADNTTRNIFSQLQSLNFATLNQGIWEATFNYLLKKIPIGRWSVAMTDFTVRLLETAPRRLCTP